MKDGKITEKTQFGVTTYKVALYNSGHCVSHEPVDTKEEGLLIIKQWREGKDV